MQQGQVVNSLSLESYLQLHKALTKQTGHVQSVTPIEECYYKIGDLKQLLSLHGFTAGKFNRTELLAAMKGQKLIHPCSSNSDRSMEPVDAQPANLPEAATAAELPFSAADMCGALGVAGPSSSNPQPLRILQLGPAAPCSTAQTGLAEADPANAGVPLPDMLVLGRSAVTAAQAAPQHIAADDRLVAVAPEQNPVMDGFAAAAAAAAAARPCTQQVLQPNLHPQQQQPAFNQHQPLPEQSAAVVNQQLQHIPQTQLPQVHQQHQQQILSMPCAGAGGAGSAGGQPDPLHQLLATLLTQHAAGPAAAVMLPQLAAQPQAAGGSVPTTADLIQQLLSRSTGPHSSTTYLPAQQAANAGPSTAAATATGGAAAPAAADNLVCSNAGRHCAEADRGTAQQQVDTPQPSHTPWLKAQLEWFVENGLKLSQPLAAAAAVCAGQGCGGLLGHRVGFMLLEDMQVAGPRNIILTLPPGFYEGMAVKYLGSSCKPEVCEQDCPGQHQFYRARILPPRAVPDPGSCTAAAGGPDLAASVAQAQTATSGRPVLLILDLHSRLRSRSLEGMLQIPTAEQLQDAWVLLEHDEDGSRPEEPQPDEALPAAAAAPPAQRKGRKPGRTAGGQCKRART